MTDARDAAMKTTSGLMRQDGGTLDRVALLIDDDGRLCDHAGYPLTRTEETAELRGWGSMDGTARVYRNDGGREILYVEQATGTLYDYQTGEEIRAATPDELAASREAAEQDGGAGVIVVDDRSVYAQ